MNNSQKIVTPVKPIKPVTPPSKPTPLANRIIKEGGKVPMPPKKK